MSKECYCHVCDSNFKPDSNSFLFDGTDTGICQDCIDAMDKVELLDIATAHIKDMYVITPSRYEG